jgi:hypothetical protein
MYIFIYIYIYISIYIYSCDKGIESGLQLEQDLFQNNKIFFALFVNLSGATFIDILVRFRLF